MEDASQHDRDPALATAEQDTFFDAAPDTYYGEESATLGDRIAAARQAARLTQAGLAERLGVSKKVVSAWENDRSEPRANRLSMLAGMLNVSVAWLLTGMGEGVSPPESAVEAAAKAPPFLLAFAVSDLAETRRFYADTLGCAMGRATETSQDFEFFGHQLSAHLRPDAVAAAAGPEEERAPRFGAVLSWEAWSTLSDRIRASGVEFVVEPTVQCVGAPNEQGAFFILDPSGNALEFKCFKDPAQIFA